MIANDALADKPDEVLSSDTKTITKPKGNPTLGKDSPANA